MDNPLSSENILKHMANAIPTHPKNDTSSDMTALPLRITLTESGDEDRSDLETKLKDIFISPSRIQDLASLFRINIISKLIPGLNKDGYEIGNSAGNEASQQVHDQREEDLARRRQNRDPADSNPEPARIYPFSDPLVPAPHRRPFPEGEMRPPGFDDELDIHRPLRGMAAPHPSARSPFGIGHDDLNPPGLGPYDPLRGSFVGGGGGMGMGGGMHPTFDDPLFGGGGQGQGQGGWRPGNAPPGARYDPTGPGGAPRGGAGGAPHNPFGGFGSGL
ncbi:hypothetical protein M7I_3879 [Glarea lozoyensis 74030]|uniref:Uncharacterized protein n=1 Tax=Glarea lozoyensis (strain ATCC 74030 / MF5533) TaxID=1104152 RepID=H0EMP0_GLAL7|nr:hypothetical protein M7I_3879 [Glarea lozoyensis 74030]